MAKRNKSTPQAGFGDMAAILALIEQAPGKVEITIAMPDVGMEYILQLHALATVTAVPVGNRRNKFSIREIPLETGYAVEVFTKLKNAEVIVTAGVTDCDFNAWRAVRNV